MADSIGERLQQARKKNGWTLRRLADVAQVPVSTISAVESGSRPGHGLSLETSKKLVVALGMSLDLLAFGEYRCPHAGREI